MPVFGTFSLVRVEDGVVYIDMAPGQPVGGWSVEFEVSKRFGAGVSGLAVLTAASGFGDGSSGVTVANSGTGQFSVDVASALTSGLDPGNYACNFFRADSGNFSVIFQGYLNLGVL